MMRTLFSAIAILTLVAGTVLPAAAQSRSVGDKVDDAAITAKVKTKLSAERPGNAVKLDVDTKAGVVHLQGTVPTAEDKSKAEQIARSVDGVKEVQNDLKTTASPAASPSTTPSTRTR